MTEYMLNVSNLNKCYKKFKLQNVNLQLQKGEIMWFIGPNGAGKSTTIKSIMNIIPFDDGIITVDGKNLNENEIEIKQNIGYVGEHLDFYEKVKLKKIYKFTRKCYINWDVDLFASLVKRFDLDLEKKMNELSKGMTVKFSLAMALAHHPKLLILDEPTSGLDPVIRNDLLDILKETVKKDNSAVLFSSHITEDIAKIADTVAFIHNGEIKLISNKYSILEHYLKINTLNSIKDIKAIQVIIESDEKAIIDISNCTATEIDMVKAKYEAKNITLDELLLSIIKTHEKVS